MNYKGITAQSIILLAENRFNNSKAFYEEHKKEINEGVVYPMRALAADLQPTLESINPDFILDPVRCLSRVRRDTRFTADKSLYRENLWLMFRHQKNQLPTPMLWFEFFSDGYNYGCGIISTTPAFMEYWRKHIKSKPLPLLSAYQKVKDAGLSMDNERYKRSKAAADGIADPDLAEWYDSKQLFVSRHVDGVRRLNQPKALLAELEKAYGSMEELYRYMLDVTTRFNTRGVEDEEN